MRRILFLLFVFYGVFHGNAQKNQAKEYLFYVSKEYRQIKFNVELQIDEPLDSIAIDALGRLSLNDFKKKHPKIDSIQFFWKKQLDMNGITRSIYMRTREGGYLV